MMAWAGVMMVRDHRHMAEAVAPVGYPAND